MNSALRIVESSSSRLVIYNSPHSLLGWVFLVLGIASVIIVALLAVGSRSWPWLGMIISLALLTVAAGCLGSDTLLELSRSTGEARLTDRYFYLHSEVWSVPLANLNRAVVETTDFNRSLYLVTASGSVQAFGYTSRDGYHRAVDAINSFLAVGQPSLPADHNR